jgi:hypothetical protein
VTKCTPGGVLISQLLTQRVAIVHRCLGSCNALLRHTAQVRMHLALCYGTFLVCGLVSDGSATQLRGARGALLVDHHLASACKSVYRAAVFLDATSAHAGSLLTHACSCQRAGRLHSSRRLVSSSGIKHCTLRMLQIKQPPGLPRTSPSESIRASTRAKRFWAAYHWQRHPHVLPPSARESTWDVARK